MNIDASRKSINSESRNGAHPIMLVLHSTAGRERSDVPTLLGLTSRRVSSHYYITKDGRIMQFVPDAMAAWATGAASWLGHGAGWIQDNSISIELENLNNGKDPYPDAQYAALLELSRSLVSRYKIAPEYFVRHLDIAPVRKSDPAGFPWESFKAEVYGPGTSPKVIDEQPSDQPRSTPYPGAAQPKENVDIQDVPKTAVDAAVSGLWQRLIAGWSSFLDALGGLSR